jgi:hypothetical protein
VLKLHFITSGSLTVKLSGFYLDRVAKGPAQNLKTFLTGPDNIYLEAKDMGYFTDWGIVELKPVAGEKERSVIVMIDSLVWGWYGTAQIVLFRDGQIIASDNFQSGVKGPVGDPKRYRSYPVLEV